MNSLHIEQYTAASSGFDAHRNYLGLSNAAQDVDILVKYFGSGQSTDHLGKLKCYKGYQMERDLVGRIHRLYGSHITFKDIQAHDGLDQGHPDFWYDQDPGDCKSVLMDDHLPKDKLPRKVYWQLQGYMLYSNRKFSWIVYESRESGKIFTMMVRANEKIMDEIKTKYEAALSQINLYAK